MSAVKTRIVYIQQGWKAGRIGRVRSITQQEFPDLRRSPMMGYNNETPGLIRVFGETEDSCERQLKNVVDRIDETPWRWPRDSVQLEAMRPLGPWWHSRFERSSRV